MLEQVQPIACRAVILNGYLLLVGSFGPLARELADELGPPGAADRYFTKLIETNLRKLHDLCEGKLQMHEALRGEQADLELLNRLRRHVGGLRERLGELLRPQPPESMPDVERIRQLGRDALAICRAARADLREAQRRFSEALLISSRPAEFRSAVVSIDMVAYSRLARDREAQEGVKGLFNLNDSIQVRIESAMRAARLNIDKTPAYNTGDGAIFFCEDGAEAAVNFARKFQLESVGLARVASDRGNPHRQFRIGIAYGDVCLQLRLKPTGAVWGFAAAGVAIIDAVRLQTAADPDGILIDEKTHRELSPAVREHFLPSDPVRPKAHEPRAISAFRWRPPLTAG